MATSSRTLECMSLAMEIMGNTQWFRDIAMDEERDEVTEGDMVKMYDRLRNAVEKASERCGIDLNHRTTVKLFGGGTIDWTLQEYVTKLGELIKRPGTDVDILMDVGYIVGNIRDQLK